MEPPNSLDVAPLNLSPNPRECLTMKVAILAAALLLAAAPALAQTQGDTQATGLPLS